MDSAPSKVSWVVAQLLLLLMLSPGFVWAQQPVDGAATAQIQVNDPSLVSVPTAEAPLVVWADFQLLGINNIDDKEETFEFIGILTLRWQDQRLSFDPARERVAEKIYQGDYQINEVFAGWSPQVVLMNQAGLFETSASLLRIQPDGTATLSQMINAVAEVKLSMRRLPFDHQTLEALFGIFGFDKSKVELRAAQAQGNRLSKTLAIDQWNLTDAQTSIRELVNSNLDSEITSSAFVVSLGVQRDSFFLVRLVIFPLAFIVMLTWSVFWIDRAAISDRINICFVGILTAVAYQIVLGDRLPQISYVTFINGFLNISFVMMSATVVVNLVIGSLDKRGNSARADLIERRSRWIFPITYVGLVLLALAVAFILF